MVEDSENITKGRDIQMNHRKELITALSNEILKYSELILMFRTRIAFVAWVGPFVVLGSFIIAREGDLSAIVPGIHYAFLAILIIVCYVLVGYIASRIEKQAWEQCNRVRRIISNLAADEDYNLKFEDYRDNIGDTATKTYVSAYVFIIASAIAAAVLVYFASSAG